MDKILVVGGGSWGTAFADYLAARHRRVRLWVREEEIVRAIARDRQNPVFLPGIRLRENLMAVDDLAAEARSADVLVFAVPSNFSRRIFQDLRGHLQPEQILVNLSKGIESSSLKTLSQIAADVFGADVLGRWVTLSGPSFARELAQEFPTALVGASSNSPLLERLQREFSSAILRIYRTADLIGVEVGGAVKNVMAIASGMVSGLGYGYNTTASLVTRASMEILRLGLHLGARPETFWGLAGIGDLMLTCFGPLSRNFQLGREIAGGKTLAEIQSATPMVAEGVETARAVQLIAERSAIEMPISAEVHRVLFAGKNPRRAVEDLMTRRLKAEWSIN